METGQKQSTEAEQSERLQQNVEELRFLQAGS